MEAADLLCDSLFRWLENRKKCAEKLLKLAQKLEKVNRRSNIAQGFGGATAVLSITGAVVVGVLTGGLFPLLALATVGTVVGTGVSVTPTLQKANVSRKTFNKATELIKEDEEVGTSIQKQLQDLKDRCGGTQLGAHADELECEVTTQLMWALARRNKTVVPLDFLRGFNRATFFRHITSGGLDPTEALRFICQALNLIRVPVIKSSLKVLDAIGLDRSLSNLIVNCEEIVKRKQISEASKFLRDSALEILDGQQELKEQLDAMHEIIQKLFRMKNLVKDLGGYSLCLTENGQNVMDYIMGTCTDSTVISWLEGITHQIELVNLLRFVLENLGPLIKDFISPGGGHIDIVIVGHGRIINQFMPAGGLVPTPTIRDTILYSPWNCSIDSYAAFGIAQGLIDVTNRQFYYTSNMLYYEPNNLPQRWNSMRRSLHNIPGILLYPLTPEEEAWTFFHFLLNNGGLFTEDCAIIPYVVPQNMLNAFGEIPLYILIFVTSFILMVQGKTATVHLAACLDRAGSPPRRAEWRRQYAYTSDGTRMTMNMDDFRHISSRLLNALMLMFDS